MTVVRDQTVGAYLEALASAAAVPGGGSAAALAAAMGAALVSMVAKLSARKTKSVEDRELLTALVPELDQLAARLLELSQDDIDAYRAVIDARKSGAQADALARVYERAADVPLEAATAASRPPAASPTRGSSARSPAGSSCCSASSGSASPIPSDFSTSAAATSRFTS